MRGLAWVAYKNYRKIIVGWNPRSGNSRSNVSMGSIMGAGQFSVLHGNE